jgi:hypothetical protein
MKAAEMEKLLIIFDPQSEKTLKIVIVVIDSVDFIE